MSLLPTSVSKDEVVEAVRPYPITLSMLMNSVLMLAVCTMAFRPAVAQNSPPLMEWEDQADSRPFPAMRMSVPPWRLKNGPQVRAAFRRTISETRRATVRVRTDGRDTALGVIVREEGYVLTKASQLPGDLTCIFPDQRELKAKIVAIDREYDLAILKVDADGLPFVKLDPAVQAAVGSWLATVGMNRGPIAVGVVSVEPRSIMHRSGVLGVQFVEANDEPIIERVFPETAASEAGLKEADEVLSLNGEKISSRETLIRRVREFSPGDRIQVQVRRGEETLHLSAKLKDRSPWRMPTRDEFQNQLGSLLSQRRFGFPVAFQHDTVVKPTDCGGAVVDLDGNVLGINIARAGRTETYAIPTEVVVKLLEEIVPSKSAQTVSTAAP